MALDRASPAMAAAVATCGPSSARLIYPGFIADTGAPRLPDLARYLQGISRRLDKAPVDPAVTPGRMAVVHRVTDAYRQVHGRPAGGRRGGAVPGRCAG